MGLGRGAPELPWMVGLLDGLAGVRGADGAAGRARRRSGLRAAVDPRHRGVGGRGLLRADLRLRLAGFGAPLDGDPPLPESWPGLALGLALAPFVVFQLAAIDASVRAHGGTPTTQRHLRGFQVRMFLAVVAPIAAFVLASAAIALFPWLRAQVEHVGLVWTLFMVLFVGAMAHVFPRVVRWAWDTEPFPDGPQRELLDDVARRSNFEPAALRIWRTGNLVANATIIGLTRRGLVVLFSDELLSVLNSRELSAVYAHEIGHAVRGHVGIFLAWTAGFFLIGDLAVARTLEGSSLAAGLALGAALAGLWFVTFAAVPALRAGGGPLQLRDRQGSLRSRERAGARRRRRSHSQRVAALQREAARSVPRPRGVRSALRPRLPRAPPGHGRRGIHPRRAGRRAPVRGPRGGPPA